QGPLVIPDMWPRSRHLYLPASCATTRARSHTEDTVRAVGTAVLAFVSCVGVRAIATGRTMSVTTFFLAHVIVIVVATSVFGIRFVATIFATLFGLAILLTGTAAGICVAAVLHVDRRSSCGSTTAVVAGTIVATTIVA